MQNRHFCFNKFHLFCFSKKTWDTNVFPRKWVLFVFPLAQIVFHLLRRIPCEKRFLSLRTASIDHFNKENPVAQKFPFFLTPYTFSALFFFRNTKSCQHFFFVGWKEYLKKNKTFSEGLTPTSMLGIFTDIWLNLMVNVGKYTIRGLFGTGIFGIRFIVIQGFEGFCPQQSRFSNLLQQSSRPPSSRPRQAVFSLPCFDCRWSVRQQDRLRS